MEEDETLTKHDILHPNTLISWKSIHLSSQSPTISLPDPHVNHESTWSTPPTTTLIFPPINHEGLNFHPQFELPDPHLEKPKPKSSVSVSSELQPKVIGGFGDVKWWFLRFKLKSIVLCVCDWCLNKRGLLRLVNFPMIGTVVLLVYLRFRRRRQRRRLGEVVDELLEVVKEKDERIQQLLHQIARMNELLLASHHGVPMISKATST